MSKYPLIEKWLGLSVISNGEHDGKKWQLCCECVMADQLEQKLSEGVQVYNAPKPDGSGLYDQWTQERAGSDTHTAILIGITELKPKSKEERALDLLKDLIYRASMTERYGMYVSVPIKWSEFDEVKALLAEVNS